MQSQFWSTDWLNPAILSSVAIVAAILGGALAVLLFSAVRRAHARSVDAQGAAAEYSAARARLTEVMALLATREQDVARLNLELATANQRLKRLRRLVVVDPLTGIANRRHFDRALEREIRRARRSRMHLSLIFVDIDGFKAYNDTHGHAKGDEVLRDVAQTLDDTCRRGGDLAARYGGEEFVILLPGVDSGQASLYAERLRRQIWRLEIPYPGGPAAERLTISAGVATLSPEEVAADPTLLARAPEILVNSADAALYRAKCLGRNRVAVKTSSGPAIEAVGIAS